MELEMEREMQHAMEIEMVLEFELERRCKSIPVLACRGQTMRYETT
jgi:hypothetical protein